MGNRPARFTTLCLLEFNYTLEINMEMNLLCMERLFNYYFYEYEITLHRRK